MRATSAWGQIDRHACLKAMCFYWETGLPVWGARIMETLTYFSCHSRQVDVATWSFLVLPIDKENLYRLSREWYIYIEMSSSLHHTLAYIDRNLPVGDNRGTVNTSTTPHISDQLGTENACNDELCWVIVMIRVLVCNNMYQYEHHFGSFYHNPTILEAVSIHCQLTGKLVNEGFYFIFFNTMTGNNSGTDVSLLR